MLYATALSALLCRENRGKIQPWLLRISFNKGITKKGFGLDHISAVIANFCGPESVQIIQSDENYDIPVSHESVRFERFFVIHNGLGEVVNKRLWAGPHQQRHCKLLWP
jgi:hypothetical protein